MKVQFSINEYNEDGDLVETGIHLHIDSKIRLTFRDLVELKEFADHIQDSIIPEIIKYHLYELSESDQAELGD